MEKTLAELRDLFMNGEITFLEGYFDFESETLRIGENEISGDGAYARIYVDDDWSSAEITMATEPVEAYYVLSFDEEEYKYDKLIVQNNEVG